MKIPDSVQSGDGAEVLPSPDAHWYLHVSGKKRENPSPAEADSDMLTETTVYPLLLAKKAVVFERRRALHAFSHKQCFVVCFLPLRSLMPQTKRVVVGGRCTGVKTRWAIERVPGAGTDDHSLGADS